ncbi:MAG: 2Fe-2S iron-sulfur cluster-binding protein [Actinobacteria bacterium]|nr:2Fe-2S iron-sulfur cluster-binding protein [Cyanobacteriota bacterium]MCL5772638.1 2Fe-2S iron-sulfur cluster-binding protein [Actinomycetota bacterium]
MAKEKIKAKILRFDPDKDKQPYFQDYDIDVNGPVSISELLALIRRNIDSTLAFRTYKCYKGSCQTCVVRYNGKVVKACATQIMPNSEITLEPAAGGKVVRDLVVDFAAM